MPHDLLVLGAGPAGLGAALEAARAGARVAIADGADRVGGLCVTLRRDGLAYDLGGHIPFVRDERRRRWLEELLGGDLVRVRRPVACVLDGHVVRGRYLDQRPPATAGGDGDGGSAYDFLAARFGAGFVERTMRRYLEKVDGMPLERIPAIRPKRLMEDQAAPDGFWYPAEGIGQLMDAMAAAAEALGAELLLGRRVEQIAVSGSRVRAVTLQGPDGPAEVAAGAVVAGLPPTVVARLVEPPPAADLPSFPMRAAALVYLVLDRGPLTPEPWIQVDDPRVPFARMFEVANWSTRLVPDGRTVLGCECYADPGSALWSMSDAELAQACAAALRDPLGLLDEPEAARLAEVVRIPRAWPLVALDRLAAARRAAGLLDGLGGLQVAQGGDVVQAIEAGERAAHAVLAGSPGTAGADGTQAGAGADALSYG
ncbi:MAG TPA: FAD-dependent oxidoreductase [Miltoncostaeaceae bacterium]|nr:FAD-dependent oxidoreductase [Miltoncostaeaceae bacterium]